MLIVSDLCKQYGKQAALAGISLQVPAGECVSVIGESGSGKSTLTRLILALEKPTSGNVIWNGNDVRTVAGKRLYQDIQPVFQDNAGCFNPRRSIGDSLYEPMKHLLKMDLARCTVKAAELLDMVELPRSIVKRYPHELSGGQLKRICIARALSINPKLIVLDEAVSGLDMAVMVRILVLLKNLQKELGCAYLFITHDIRTALYMSKTVIVMRGGKIIESVHDIGSLDDFTHPFSVELASKIKKRFLYGGNNEKNIK